MTLQNLFSFNKHDMKNWLVKIMIGSCGLLLGCTQKKLAGINDAELLHQNQDQLTQAIIYDVFTPPVASRIYVYSSLAAYEAIKFSKPGYLSITEKLHGFKPMPVPDKTQSYNYTLAASHAFFWVINKLVFSKDSLNDYAEKTDAAFKHNLPAAVYARSVAFGDSIGSMIMQRAKADGYTKSRSKPKYLGSSDPGKWRPTPPDYLDGVEWCWNTMQPLTLDSAAQFLLPPVPKYSKDSNSVFYKMAMEVYSINQHLTEEQKTIAHYWDDNPFIMEHAGHLSFGTKKITPGGHWMGIAAIAAKQTQADAVKTAQGYALTAIALYDGFIACWDEKYRSSLVRPVTVINEWKELGWSPLLQTPPFPEYPSGHSAITAAASTVLAKIYGAQFSFLDTSDLRYIGMKRHFNSFQEAAAEASVSRVYGGIHYRYSVDAGAAQGKKVGALIIDKILK